MDLNNHNLKADRCHTCGSDARDHAIYEMAAETHMEEAKYWECCDPWHKEDEIKEHSDDRLNYGDKMDFNNTDRTKLIAIANTAVNAANLLMALSDDDHHCEAYHIGSTLRKALNDAQSHRDFFSTKRDNDLRRVVKSVIRDAMRNKHDDAWCTRVVDEIVRMANKHGH